MDTKLTLKLEQGIILKAKEYAALTNQSLSRLVEQYFIEITSDSDKFKQSLSPKVKKLSGILKGKKINYKEDVSNYLSKKYLKK